MALQLPPALPGSTNRQGFVVLFYITLLDVSEEQCGVVCLKLLRVGSHSHFHTKSHQQLLSKIYGPPKKGKEVCFKCVLPH